MLQRTSSASPSRHLTSYKMRPSSQWELPRLWKQRSWWFSVTLTWLSLVLPILSADRARTPPRARRLAQLGEHLHVGAYVIPKCSQTPTCASPPENPSTSTHQSSANAHATNTNEMLSVLNAMVVQSNRRHFYNARDTGSIPTTESAFFLEACTPNTCSSALSLSLFSSSPL